MSDNLVFLKLGGSLITDKNTPHTPRLDVIRRLASEIAFARKENPRMTILLGHGSGSFGHIPAKQYNTRQGVTTPAQWLGFAAVWQEARLLNEIIIEALFAAGLPVIAFPPSAFMLAQDGVPGDSQFQALRSALDHALLPLINGDVVFDSVRGGTILSTEDIFSTLVPHLKPARILLAGIEKGVWADFPTCSQLIPHITPQTFPQLASHIHGSASVDVTGGMLQKVKSMLNLARDNPGLQTLIFSALEPNCLQQALLGASPGTIVSIA